MLRKPRLELAPQDLRITPATRCDTNVDQPVDARTSQQLEDPLGRGGAVSE